MKIIGLTTNFLHFLFPFPLSSQQPNGAKRFLTRHGKKDWKIDTRNCRVFRLRTLFAGKMTKTFSFPFSISHCKVMTIRTLHVTLCFSGFPRHCLCGRDQMTWEHVRWASWAPLLGPILDPWTPQAQPK